MKSEIRARTDRAHGDDQRRDLTKQLVARVREHNFLFKDLAMLCLAFRHGNDSFGASFESLIILGQQMGRWERSGESNARDFH